MKFLKSIPIILAIALMSCDSNDDQQDDQTMNDDGFTYHQNSGTTTFYETTNMYIEIDEDNDDAFPNAPDDYRFFFLNGRLIDRDSHPIDPAISGEIMLSTNTTNFAVLTVDVATHVELQTGIPPTANNTYVASREDSNIIHDSTVNPINPPFFLTLDGTSFEFGNGDDTVGTIHEPATLGHSVTINAINIDTTTPSNSSIDVDYTFVNTSGELISGHYTGTLGIIED